MKTKYQNLKFFNKEGYEIPLAVASNIVIKIYSKEINSERNATILNGVYMLEKNENNEYIINNFKIIEVGNSFTSKELSIEDVVIDLYIDGVLVDKSLYYIKDNLIDFEFESFNVIKTTTMDKDDDFYVRYGIVDVKDFCLIIKEDLTTNLIFPSFVFTSNIEMETISAGLHSTETLYFGLADKGELVDIEDEKYDILFLTDVKDDDVQFFTFDDVTEEIYKSHSAYVSLQKENSEENDIRTEEGFNNVINIQKYNHISQSINICFMSNEEGVHEQTIYIMLVDRADKSKQYKIGEINVIINVEGEDERFRALFSNFGIPDPKTYPTLFKEADIKEDNINWELVNRKSKELFLSYSDIFPYVGTYKSLINAVKYLGYDDVYFREWYRDIKNNINISKRININENFNDYKNNLTYDDIISNRLSLKKLNKLSLFYKLNKETEECDEIGTPIVINTYNYNVDEIILKLKSLKEWLERHILALNCRIVDITGEGIVYERVPIKIYGSNMQNFIYEDYLRFTPIVKNKNVILNNGEAEIGEAIINVTVLNDSSTSYFSFDDFDESFGDYKNDNISNITYPFINNMYVKAFVSCENAKISSKFGNYLFINEGEILLKKDEEEFTFDKAPIIYLEKGNLKSVKWSFDNKKYDTIEEWWNKKDFIIDKSDEYSYFIKDTNGEVLYSNDFICFLPIEDNEEKLHPKMKYSINSLYNTKDNAYYSALDAPVFILNDYTICTYDEKNNVVKTALKGEYIVEIIDGKFVIYDNDYKTSFININYDDNTKEQSVKVNYQYEGYKVNDNDNLNNDNVFYNIKVNNAGHYDIVVYAINENGNIFGKKIEGGCDVIVKQPEIDIITNKQKIENDDNFYIEDSSGEDIDNINGDILPIFKSNYNIHNIEINQTYCNYPSISYAYNTPKEGDYLQFMNICDKFYCKKDGTFITFGNLKNKFNTNDLVNIVVYDNKYLNGISETTGRIKSIFENNIYEITYIEENDKKELEELKCKYVYIFPIQEHKIDDVKLKEKDNETIVKLEKNEIDPSSIYSVGEIVKLKYVIKNNLIIVDNVVYYRDEETQELFPVYDAEGNMLLYEPDVTLFAIGNESGDEVSYSFFGTATFRIKRIDNINNEIVLDGLFNYKKYSANGTIVTSLSISKSNEKYVNYILRCKEDAEEYVDDNKNMTKVEMYDSRLFDYMDNTYTFIPLSFDKVNAFDYWFDINEITEEQSLYLHKNIPMTLDKDNDYIIFRKKNISTDDKDNYRWRLYRRNVYNNMRELLFEIENEILSIKTKEEGIYDVELDVFDKNGNKAQILLDSILKIKG